MCAGHYTPKLTLLQSRPLWNGLRTLLIIVPSIWFLQRW
jgi:hypothetical protein